MCIHGKSCDEPTHHGHQVWRSYANLFLSCTELWRLAQATIDNAFRQQRMHRTTWPVCRGKYFPYIWNPCYRLLCSLCNLRLTYSIKRVIRQNSAPLCGQVHTTLCIRQVTWSVNRDSTTATVDIFGFWNPRPHFAYLLQAYNIHWAAITIESHLYVIFCD